MDEYGFPPFERVTDVATDGEVPREVLQETSYDQASLQATIDQRTPNLTEDQRYAIETVLTSVRGEGTDHFFFLDSPGGTGKTYTTNLLLAKVRLGGGVAIAVASSGIAATFLQWAHSPRPLQNSFGFSCSNRSIMQHWPLIWIS